MFALVRNFVDRVPEIEQFNAALYAEGTDKDSCILVHGQSGIGKTQLLAKYLYVCNDQEIRIGHVDLGAVATKGYLGLIEAMIEGLGNDGFEELDKTFNTILKNILERSEALLENAAIREPRRGRDMVFNMPVTGEVVTFVSGDVNYHDSNIHNIYQIQLLEPGEMEVLIQKRVTRTFRECLQKIARVQPIVILLDHWDAGSDLLKGWLEEHLLSWATNRALKKILVVVTSECVPEQFEARLGIRPLPLSHFSREIALEFWLKNGLAEADFESIRPETFGIPSHLKLEVGKRLLLMRQQSK